MLRFSYRPDSAECDNKSVLDLSKQQLRKIPKQPAEIAQHVRVLILDENELQKIDNVDAYMRIEHVRRINRVCLCINY